MNRNDAPDEFNANTEGESMRKLIILILGALLAGNAAYAADTDCAAKAAEKKLAGAAKASFMKKCERDAIQSSCDQQAADKKLAGAAKASFTKKCVTDSSMAAVQKSCDLQAADKKLAGAAKASFTKKCVANASR